MLSSDSGIMRGDDTDELLPAELAPAAEHVPDELPPAVQDDVEEQDDDGNDDNNNQFLPAVVDEGNNKQGNGVSRPAASRTSATSSVSSNMSGQRIARSRKRSPQEEVSNFDRMMMMMAEDRKREDERHRREMEQQMRFQNMMMMMMFQRTPPTGGGPPGGGPRSQDDINLGMMHQILSPGAALENNILVLERVNEEDAARAPNNETQDDSSDTS
jgi:hypothetical protein